MDGKSLDHNKNTESWGGFINLTSTVVLNDRLRDFWLELKT